MPAFQIAAAVAAAVIRRRRARGAQRCRADAAQLQVHPLLLGVSSKVALCIWVGGCGSLICVRPTERARKSSARPKTHFIVFNIYNKYISAV